jgi:catalase
VSPVKYELGFYITEDDILHSHCRESLKSLHFFACFCRYNTGDDDNFSQPSIFWKKTLKPEERDRLVQNIVDHLKDAADFIQVDHCFLLHGSMT